MKKQIRHLASVNAAVTVGAELSKVELTEGCFGPTIGVFYVPTTSLDSFGFVPSAILVSRSKHDLGITFDHYSYSTGVAK